jgi:hypothetical protein
LPTKAIQIKAKPNRQEGQNIKNRLEQEITKKTKKFIIPVWQSLRGLRYLVVQIFPFGTSGSNPNVFGTGCQISNPGQGLILPATRLGRRNAVSS